MVARPWAERLTNAFGVAFVVENRGGASGTIGVEAAVRASPDGTTFLLTPNSAINVVPQLRKLSYDARKDLMPIARMGDLVGGFVSVKPLGFKTMTDLVSYGKQNPGKLVFGTPGLGTSVHMRFETLKLRAGIDMLHVPYRGSGDAMTDLLGGSIHLTNEVVVYPHVKAGKLDLLAVNNPTWHWEFPNTPTMTEAGFPNSDVPIWFSLWAPVGTSKEIIEILGQKVADISKTPEMVQRMRDISLLPVIQTPEELSAFFDLDWEANARVIREAKITLS